MKVYHPSKFEVVRHLLIAILWDFGVCIFIPTYIIAHFLNIKVESSKYTEPILWFWLITASILLFWGYKNFDIKRLFIIEMDEKGVRLQYYKGWFYFLQKLVDVTLKWQDVENIKNTRYIAVAIFEPIINTLYIKMKNGTEYELEVPMCSTLMKTIDEELNEMLKQYGEQKEEQ